jgi:ATP-binding cassette subfamily C exporter for protease/lipase
MSTTALDIRPEPVARPSGSFFRRSELGRAMWSFRREFAWVGLFSLVANLLMLTPTLYMLQVFDRVLVSGSALTLAALTALSVFLFLVMGFAEWVRSRLLVRASAALDQALSTRVFQASFEARLRNTMQAGGRLPQQALGDLTGLRQFLTGNGVFAFFDMPWTLIYIAVLFLMHPWLGWAAIVFSIIQCTAAVWGHRIVKPLHDKAMEGVGDSQAFLHAKLRNAEVVEAMGMRGSLRRLWLQVHQRQLQGQGVAFEHSQRLQAFTKFLQYTQQSLTLALGALLAVDGQIGVGAMIASNALIANALRPIGTLVQTWRQFLDARQSYGRLESLLHEYPARPDGRLPDAISAQITLKGLVATAPGREEPILRGLDAEFKAGEVIGIVGPSGAGKSTLARCLVGIWPDTQGQVLLDGHPIGDWQRQALGAQLGYLPQDIELMDGNIAENIARFGNVDSEQVIEAARRTGLHDMILRLPKGYDTPMGEAGSLLSGGQRQRIGLARALYGDPALVVLDEPNASLDDAGEAALVHAVRDLEARGKTVFMVAHQQHLLAAADRVLVLEQGQLVRLAPVVLKPDAAAAPTVDPAS